MHSNTVQETTQSLPFGPHWGPRSSCGPFLEAPSPHLSSKVSRSFSRSCKHNCFNPLPLPHSFVSIKIKNICKKNIEKVWYQYGLHQYLCDKPWTLQGNFWCVMASLMLSGLDAAKSMGLDVAKSMGLDAAKSWLVSLRKFQNQPVGLDCEESCVIKPKNTSVSSVSDY